MSQEEVKKYEKDRNRRITQALVALLGVAVAITLNILYVGYSQRQADKRWCALMIGLDDNYRSADLSKLPQRTRDFAAIVHNLRGELHCAKTPPPPPPSAEPSAAPSGGDGN